MRKRGFIPEVAPDPETGCWNWEYSKNNNGYGYINAGGKRQYIHRLVYESLIGPVPEGMELDHLCRNRACCNPWHLEPVTSAENSRRGCKAKTTAERVVAAREGFAHNGWSVDKVAAYLGVQASSVDSIVRGKSWKDVGGPLVDSTAKKIRRRTDRETVEMIWSLRDSGLLQSEVAGRFDVGLITVRNVWSGKHKVIQQRSLYA